MAYGIPPLNIHTEGKGKHFKRQVCLIFFNLIFFKLTHLQNITIHIVEHTWETQVKHSPQWLYFLERGRVGTREYAVSSGSLSL